MNGALHALLAWHMPSEWLRRLLAAAALLLVVPVAAIDFMSGPHLRLAVFYLAPITLAAWYGGRLPAAVGAIASALCCYVDGRVAMPPDLPGFVLIAGILADTAFFLIVGEMVRMLRQALDRQASLASTDALTGLLNFRAFRDRLAGELASARRSGERVGVLFRDCDNFKKVNDTLGHRAGDDLLRTIAAAMAGSIRAGDAAARIGGDEFVIVLRGVDRAGVAAGAGRTREAITSAIRATGLPVTVSIGAATFRPTGDSVDQVLSRADSLQYAAKRAGKDRAVVEDASPIAAAA